MQNDLICKFTSWYHLLGVISYLENLSEKPNNIIIVQGQFFNKQIDLTSIPLGQYCKNHYVTNSNDSLLSTIRKINKNKNPMTIVAPTSAIRTTILLLREGIRHDIVRTEEGIGSYGETYQYLKSYIREMKNQHGTPVAKSIARAFINILFSTIHKLSIKSRDWLLFDKKTLQPREDVVANYKKALKAITSNLAPVKLDTNKATVFISAPFIELGTIDVCGFSKIITYIKSMISNDDNLFVKPHPIEDQTKFSEINIIPPNLALEQILLWNNKLDIKLIGFTSTSLYTSNILFGIKPFRLSAHDYYYNSLSRRQRELIDSNSICI